MVLPLIASIAGGVIGALGSRSSAKTQASAANNAADAQLKATRETNNMLRGFRTEDIARFQPFYNSGLGAQNALAFEMGVGSRPDGYRGFQATPGYQFAVDQAQDGVQNSVAARQGLNSGAAMDALQRNRIGMANQEYGNFLGRLGGLASGGQNAAGMQGSASQAFGGQIGSNMMQGGQARAQGIANAGNANAAGTVGAVNAFTGMTNNLVGNWQMNQMNNAFSRAPGTPAPATPAWNTSAFWTGNY
jgi:hypothetical protein